jgi:4a-hydroxytetrahydrobiopterin dehydratase
MRDDMDTNRCTPCKTGVAALTQDEIRTLNKGLSDGWQVVSDLKLEKEYKFSNFSEALCFVNKVGSIADAENHHPNISLKWGYVRLSLWTHKVGGVTRNDFILASKIDESERRTGR